MAEVTCRTLTPDDHQFLPGLEQAVFGAEAWSAAEILRCVRTSGLVTALAEVDDVPAGYVLTRVADDEAELLTIGIVPEHRHQGLGQKLWHYHMGQLRAVGVKTVFLTTRTSNTSAQAFYDRLGGQRVGTRKEYYQPLPNGPSREDAVIYRFEIGGGVQI